MEKTNALGRRALFKRLLGSTAIAAAASALFPAERALAQVAATPLLRRRPLANIATPPAPSAPLTNPPAIVAASDGSCALDIVERTVALGTQQVRVRAFVDPNNLSTIAAPLVGPTITLAGNTTPQTEGNVQNVTVRLTNKLPIEVVPHQHASANAGEQPHGFNTTNLHTHGLHVAPDQDNVYVELSPSLVQVGACLPPVGQDPTLRCNYRYDYKYNFGQTPTGKTKLPAGTYWYHPHKHGSVGLQVASGMSGALIVKGDLDAIPEIAAMAERVMVVQYVEYTTPTDGGTATVDSTVFYTGTPTNTQLSINGQINPSVALQYGEIQRWRVVNATAEQFFYLSIAPVGATVAPPQLYAIATDGVALTNSGTMTVPYLLGTPNYAASSVADVIMNEVAVLAPGQRLDLLVQMPAATGSAAAQTYALQAVQFPSVTEQVATQTIATIQVAGTKSPANAMPASTLFNENALYRPTVALPPLPFVPTQTLAFAFDAPGNNSSINKLQFAVPPPAQIQLKLNAVDVWSVTGAGNALHAFHIHINSFLMSQRNGVSILPAAIWRDTVRLDPIDGISANSFGPGIPPNNIPALPQPVQFVSQQLDYTGDFVLHCHVLQHEDTGMMLSVAITA